MSDEAAPSAVGPDGPNLRSRVAVVGGGISGLAAAHRLIELTAGRVDVTLFEAGSRLGGVFGTESIDGYLVETGADMFITNKPHALSLCQRLGLRDHLLPTDETFRRSLVLRKGRPVEIPEGFQLLSPSKVWPILASTLFSPWGKLRMGLEYLLPCRQTGEDESLASFVRRRFGQEALERLIQPLVGGIYTSDPERLSLRATLPRFLEMERTHGSLIRALRHKDPAARQKEAASGARYGLFLSLKGGLSELLSALEARLRSTADVRLQTRVQRVVPTTPDAGTGGYVLHLSSGTSEAFDGVILATAAPVTAGLIDEWLPEAGRPLREIEYASAAIVLSGHRLADVSHPMDCFGLVIPAIEKRKILAVSIPSRKFPHRAPEGRVLLRTFVGGAMQPQMLDHSDEELCRIVSDELASIFGVGGQPDFMKVVRWTRAMPQYHVGHLDRVAAIDQALAPYSTLRLAGNAYRGVGLPDCIQSGEQAAETLANALAKPRA